MMEIAESVRYVFLMIIKDTNLLTGQNIKKLMRKKKFILLNAQCLQKLSALN